MASNYNNRAKSAAPASDGDPTDLKLVIGVGAFIVLCFLVGYFVLGKRFGDASSNAATPTNQNAAAPIVVASGPDPAPKGTLTIIDNTAAMEAKRKKAEEEAKKKADAEAKKKAEEEAKRLAAQEAIENTISPSPTATSAAPDADDLPAKPTPTTTPSPVPDPGDIAPTPEAVATPTPEPSPSPVPATPEDPEDRAMNPAPSATASSSGLYRVRVGTFEGKKNAEVRAAELKAAGFETVLSTDVVDGKVLYRLQVAAYKSEKTAREFARQVEAKGFKTTVSRN
jgi:cell division protein FtsN